MPTFFVDDRPIEFEPGETLLRAMLRQGAYVPHYCFHPGLEITAQCRQCLVEITDMGNGRGMPRLQASCSTPAAENMRVTITSDKVREGQELVNEFLLVNHPLDCSICDQAGECDLQNTAHDFGSGHSEMVYEKRVYGWRDIGTFLMLERNRCIQCSRCERFGRDISGTHDFGAFLRGHELTFDTYDDKQITHKFQGNLADICPVGCITNRDWRFKKRAWKLKKAESVCPSCSTGCNITVEHHENKVFRLKPRENQEVNRWWMCDEGRIGFHDLNEKSTRLMEPQARVKGSLKNAGWQSAMDALMKKLGGTGVSGKKVVALTDTHATNEEMHQLAQLLKSGFNSDQVYFPLAKGKPQETPPKGLEDKFIYSLITTDKSPNTTGAAKAGLLGDDDGSAAKAALQGAKVVLVLGNPYDGEEAIRNAAKKAELVVVLASHKNPWCETADVILPGFTYAEKFGTFVNKAGRVQRINPSVKPPPMAKDQVSALSGILAALDKGEMVADGRQAMNAMGQQDGVFKGMDWDNVGPLGRQLGK